MHVCLYVGLHRTGELMTAGVWRAWKQAAYLWGSLVAGSRSQAAVRDLAVKSSLDQITENSIAVYVEGKTHEEINY